MVSATEASAVEDPLAGVLAFHGAVKRGASARPSFKRRFRSGRRVVTAAVVRQVLALAERTPHGALREILRYAVEPGFHLVMRKLALQHIGYVYGEALSERKRRRLARTVSRSFIDYTWEFIGLLQEGEAFYADRIDDADAKARVQAFLAAHETGFVGVSAHIGNWELLGHWMGCLCPDRMGAVIAKRLPNPHLNQIVEDARKRLGVSTVYRDQPLRDSVRVLRKGRAVAALPDQDVRLLSGAFLEFFGRRAYTPLGPARLAFAADVPLMCGFAVRTGPGFKIIFTDPVYPDRTQPRGEEILRLTRAWTREVENIVRQYPEQWAWFHRRWRTTPETLIGKGREPLDLGALSNARPLVRLHARGAAGREQRLHDEESSGAHEVEASGSGLP